MAFYEYNLHVPLSQILANKMMKGKPAETALAFQRQREIKEWIQDDVRKRGLGEWPKVSFITIMEAGLPRGNDLDGPHKVLLDAVTSGLGVDDGLATEHHEYRYNLVEGEEPWVTFRVYAEDDWIPIVGPEDAWDIGVGSPASHARMNKVPGKDERIA